MRSMIKKLFTGQINSITVAALLVALSSLASRLLGIFRDRILAGQFGAGDTLDIYYAAFRIPDLIYNLIVLGALSAGFIPILTKLIKDYKCEGVHTNSTTNQEAWNATNNVLNILSLSLIIISILGFLFSPYLTKLIAPGFSLEKQALTTSLTRIMFLSPLFLGISSILGGILQAFKGSSFILYPQFFIISALLLALFTLCPCGACVVWLGVWPLGLFSYGRANTGGFKTWLSLLF